MKSKAAVAWQAKKPLCIEEIDVMEPKEGEVLLKTIASGVCHTDAFTLSGNDPEGSFPCVLGHEGGCEVVELGAGVKSLEVGDHVIPLYISECGECEYCNSTKTNLCQSIAGTVWTGYMPDRTRRFSKNGKDIFHYMGCSTFSEYTVVPEISLAKINIESIKESGGYLNRYRHDSTSCHCQMTFSVYLPAQAEKNKVPALYWLSGLTCSDDNARTKAGMQRYAAEHGIALIFPDTGSRGANVPDEIEQYDLGQGAGFYVNAVQPPWNKHYHMYDYITHELAKLIESQLPILANIKSISGHSMGGHGALICALKNPGSYRSVSAFSPICNPLECGWGQGRFGTYLGDDMEKWRQYDATELVKSGAKINHILIDQGTADAFYDEGQLLPENLQTVCHNTDQALTLRMQQGYDHGYHFIASFVGEHIAYHTTALKKQA